mmetsp:Transcript_67722/g.181126  ORF Transcript_67722/g.181126 Transcript_67722/m.181126 type:complete len:140 (-) Transcript_67722:2423-2842(-)
MFQGFSHFCMTTFLVPSLTSLIVDSAVTFFRDGMGLYVTSIDDKFAQVHAGPTNIVLKAVEGEAACTTGYSPFLHFDVDDMDSTIVRVLAMGAHLDGPIKYPANGKVASIRGPGGHMIGLFEPNMDFSSLRPVVPKNRQ